MNSTQTKYFVITFSMKLSIKQEVAAQKCRKRCWKKYPSQWCDLNSLHCNSPSCQGRNSQVTSCPLSKAVQFAKISQLHNCHCFIQVYSATMVDEIDLSPFSFPTSFPQHQHHVICGRSELDKRSSQLIQLHLSLFIVYCLLFCIGLWQPETSRSCNTYQLMVTEHKVNIFCRQFVVLAKSRPTRIQCT